MRICDICDKATSGITQNTLSNNNGEYPIYGASGLIKYVDFYQQSNPYIGVVKDGSGVGRVNVYPQKSSLIGTMQYIIPKAGYDLKFISYALKSLNLKTYATGAAIPHIYFKDYGKAVIPVPRLEDQERIVEELDLLSGIIDKKKAQLKELDALAQATFYDMFGDPITNDKGWEQFPFMSCIEKVSYTNKVPSGECLKEGKYPVVSQDSDFICGYWDDKSDVFTVSKPIVIFGDHTRILKYIDFDFVLGADGVKILSPADNINARYFLYCLKSFNIPSLGYSRHFKLLKELSIPVPPLSLQMNFEGMINDIESQKSLINQSIASTQTLLDATMDKYFG